jgi:cation transport ATPase
MSTVCHYCDLPMAPQGDVKGLHFCCWGCRFAWQVTGSEGESAQSRMALTRLGLAIFFTMNVMVLTLALWSKDIYGEASVGQASALYDLLRYASLFLASVVLALLGWPFAEEAGRRLHVREISTELLVVIGVFAAYTYSAYAVWTNGTHTYFEVVCMVLVAMTLGKWLQASSRVRTTSVLRQLETLLPETVRKVSTSNDATDDWVADVTSVSIRDVVAGAQIQLQPGERIPFDGLIRQGQALIDEQIVTGESVAATREVGDSVVAGSLNTDGDLVIEVIAGYSEGTLKKIVDAVVEASRSLAFRLAAWCVVLTGAISVMRGLGFLSLLGGEVAGCPMCK